MDMLLVATDGINNFFKCQYCRYITKLDLSKSTTAAPYSQTTFEYTISSKNQTYYQIVLPINGIYNFKARGSNNVEFELYDDNLMNMNQSLEGAINESGVFLQINAGTYYLLIKNNGNLEANLSFSIDPPAHTHDYTKWTIHNSTHHIECCSTCGAKGSVISPHVIKGGTSSYQKYANCLLCGCLIDLRNTIVQVPDLCKISKVTSNGSYILPNGIIVLVDEDIEAYFNGTLVFYDKNNQLVTK